MKKGEQKEKKGQMEEPVFKILTLEYDMGRWLLLSWFLRRCCAGFFTAATLREEKETNEMGRWLLCISSREEKEMVVVRFFETDEMTDETAATAVRFIKILFGLKFY
ncbi:hypothetical protein Dimus_031884 [Dionaea muscipula]